jgi:hypothetical protein
MKSITQSQTKRLHTDFVNSAGEYVDLELINNCYYAYGSELACLRLFYSYRFTPNAISVNFSKNLNTWFFRLELWKGH